MAVFLAKLSLSRSRSRVRDSRRLDFSGAQSLRGLLKATRTATGVGVWCSESSAANKFAMAGPFPICAIVLCNRRQ